MKAGDTITIDGAGECRVISVGVTAEGATYVHVASTTRGTRQKNGYRPVQMCGWLRGQVLSVSL